MGSSTQNTRTIKAPAEKIYKALTDPKALAIWQVPGDMTGQVHDFDLSIGGGYRMSLYYPDTMEGASGKTNAKEDRFKARFITLNPPYKIVEAVRFDSDDPQFAGEMIMEVTLEPVKEGTKVTFTFKDLPDGIKPEDNEEGTKSSLEKLARHVEE